MSAVKIVEYDKQHFAALVDLWKTCQLVRPWNKPETDVENALKTDSSTILLALDGDVLVGSVMCGFDGHRGWLYYLAVSPSHQKIGLGKKLVRSAENWLRDIGVPKVELMVRESNSKVIGFYLSDEYHKEPVAVMSKWLKDPEGLVCGNEQHLDVTITWLEMTVPPTRPAVHLPNLGKAVALTHWDAPSVGFYRYLYNSVGEPWFWWERRTLDDSELEKKITSSDTDIYLLSVGNVPAGFVELIYRAEDRTVEIGYFGLLPEFTGMKLGPYFLDWAIRTGWSHPAKPKRLELNTCTLDHPAALATYQRSGFVPFRQENRLVPDPRVTGLLPKDLPLPKA